MGGAIIVAAPAFSYARRHRANLLGTVTELPNRFRIDRRLVTGSASFGLRWGLSGICQGQGLLLLTGGTVQSIAFVGGVIAGFFAFQLLPQIAG
jgi:uncharacterized protein